MGIWICKPDGTIQCQDVKGESLAEARARLERVIGPENVIGERQFSVPVFKLCGMPTGRTNAFELTEIGHHLLFHGFVGSLGFRNCRPETKAMASVAVADEKPELATLIEQSGVTGAANNPVLVRELIGHPVRVYEKGSMITKDFRPDRVNVVTLDGLIHDIWFG
jgi:hypothetical protein